MRVDRSVTLSPALAWVAGLPILGCMMVMSLPALADERILAFRLFYAVAYLFWIVPLGWLQRWLWRRGAGWWAMAGVLLPVSYAMSVANALLALRFLASDSMRAQAGAAWVFGGLDGCWLALISFCGLQAIVLHRAALRAEGERIQVAAQAVRDAELRALRYQLQPHFLFNSLNAISALVQDDRPREATRMIARLGDFLRTTLEDAAAHEHTVADEIALTAAYLDVEKARLGDRLRMETYTAPGTLEARVPYMLLQPLVENAIRHGIAHRLEPGTIVIRFEREGSTLRLSVANDVVDTVEAGQGIGLVNVRARLDALYPESHRIVVGPEEGRWMVRIALPWTVA
jgi:two-component system sensor histidine kinase AlgZ